MHTTAGIQVNDATESGPGFIYNKRGITIAEQTSGEDNINLLIGTIGDHNVPSSDYSIYSASTRASYLAGALTAGSTTVNGLFAVNTGSGYGPTCTGNEINEGNGVNAEDTMSINYRGYAGANTQFRNFKVYDGKYGEMFSLTGSTKAAGFNGAVSMGALTASTADFSDIITNNAGHGTARMQLKYWPSSDAWKGTLTMWVSEPGITYHDAGIGANINVNGQYYGRQIDNGWGVYARFSKAYGTFEVWNTTGASGTGGGQGTKRLEVGSGGHLTLPTGGITCTTGTFSGMIHAAKSVSAGETVGLFIENTAGSAVGNKAVLAFGTDAGATSTNNPRIEVENVNASNGASKMVFKTHASGGNITEAFRLNSDASATFSGALTGTTATFKALSETLSGSPNWPKGQVFVYSTNPYGEGKGGLIAFHQYRDAATNQHVTAGIQAVGTYATTSTYGLDFYVGAAASQHLETTPRVTIRNSGIGVTGNIVPSIDDACNLGNASYRWKNLYISDDITTNTATISGTLTGSTATFGGFLTASVGFQSTAGAFFNGNVDVAMTGANTNLRVNGATCSTWDGGIHIKNSSNIGDETSDVAILYADGGELKCQDDDRNRTTLSSHIDGKWVYKSNNTKTGKSVEIHMEDLVKAVEEHLGVSFSEIIEGNS
jgi:hypothetical protein